MNCGNAIFKGANILYNDNHSSEIFRDMHQDKIRFSKDLGGWFFYNGKIWQVDKNNQIKKYAIDTYKKLVNDLESFQYDPNNQVEKYQYENFARFVKNMGNDAKLNAMLNCAQAYLGQAANTFDSNDLLFNCNNKTLNLQVLKAQLFSPDDYITKNCNIDFIPEAVCPNWEKFINEIFLGREEIIDFVQRFIGYSMTTSTKEQCMFILHGDGRNGKTVFIETIRRLFGDYVVSLPSNSLARKPIDNGIPNDIAGLKGARLVTTVETNENVTLDEALIKKITGSDIIKARFLNKEFFEFIPTFKIIFASNHKPNIRATDNGIWRRIRMIPFDLKVSDAIDDKDLSAKLISELPGILRWAITGYKNWSIDGLTKPDIIMQTTEAYRDEEDSIGHFIEDECVIEEDSYVSVKDFKLRIQQYNKYLSQKAIAEYMRRKGWMPKDNRITIEGQQVRAFIGICFKDYSNHKAGQKDYANTNWHE